MARDLADVNGIAERLGVTPRTVQRWARERSDFPDPIGEPVVRLDDGTVVPRELVARHRLWDLAEVEKWARAHLRPDRSGKTSLPRSGRPRRGA